MNIRTKDCYFLLLFLIAPVLCREQGSGKHAQKFVKTGTKRNVKNWDQAIVVFREMVIRRLLQSDMDIPTKPTGSATAWLFRILESKQWDKLELEMNKNVAEKEDDDSLKQLSTEFGKVMELMEKAKDNSFKTSDMAVIRGAWQNFFPQAYSSVSFTVKWMGAVTKYLTILAAGYIDLMKAGEFEECKFAEQLNVLKPAIIEAAKKLAVARYKKVGRISWGGGYKKYNTVATLTFWDGVTGELYQEIPLSQVQGRVFTPLKLTMGDLMMTHLGNKFHALYNESWASNSCTLEDKITLENFEIPYPKQCMDADGICIFPCGYYMESQTWCVTKLKNNVWQVGKKQRTWDECTLPDWDKCAPVTQLHPISWSNVYKKVNGDGRKHEVSVVDKEPTSYNKNSSNTTVLIYDGINAITALLCAEHCGEEDTLKDAEKEELNDVISAKVKDFLSRRTTEQTSDDNNDDDTTEHTKTNLLDSGLSRVVEALIVKAVLDKKRYGNITSYLDGLSRWEMTSDYIREIKSKIKEVSNNSTEKQARKQYLVNVMAVNP